MIKIRNISLFFILFIVAAPPAYSQVDIAGPWGSRRHEDDHERGEGPDIGDYSGLPINEAARFKADTWTATKWSVLEHQCEPHPSDYSPSFSSMLIYKEINEVTWETEAYKLVIGWMTPVRTIWMDGRPHPSENAPHTWEGFSTGEWHGDMLVVTTTHLKEGWIRRNGIPRSDSATLTEYFMRNGNYLTQVSIIEDPAYLTEPFIRSRDWELELGYQMTPYICSYRDEVGLEPDFVPHILPGQNTFLREYSETYDIPFEAARGGVETTYPEYMDDINRLMRD
ncbi:MAG: hypothetical protein CMQ38_01090 [Gammaproteobacteria bacterium]|nr:hypothetical protein [Gammaproteobacteria bacterium]|tara:strand:- start:668 stop:1513 length:846 start_codon:yes stop_codon:yes gene_type:complete